MTNPRGNTNHPIEELPQLRDGIISLQGIFVYPRKSDHRAANFHVSPIMEYAVRWYAMRDPISSYIGVVMSS